MRPLLLLLDYKDILRLNTLVQLFLMLMDCSSVILSFINSPSFSSGTNVLLFNPDSYRHLPSIYSVFSHYGYCCVVLLRHTNIINKFNWLFFLSLGMATSYFDFLTYPLVTLGIPLILYLQLETSSPSQRFFQITTLLFIVGHWLYWFLGRKMVAWFCHLQENLFSEAYNSIILRSSHETLGKP